MTKPVYSYTHNHPFKIMFSFLSSYLWCCTEKEAPHNWRKSNPFRSFCYGYNYVEEVYCQRGFRYPDTVSQQIVNITEDLNEQLIEKIRNKPLANQEDEATESSKNAHFITYIRCVNENKINEDSLFCKEITGMSKAEDLFHTIDSYLNTNLLDWSNCLGICNDGANSMSGFHKGLRALIRLKSPSAD